jgi:hypothetical protein
MYADVLAEGLAGDVGQSGRAGRAAAGDLARIAWMPPARATSSM